jgi:FtsZ-interacting cell division protein YlmF
MRSAAALPPLLLSNLLVSCLQRITLFRQLVANAYATALKMPKDEVVIGNIKCGSSTVYSKSRPARRPAPSRLLLSSGAPGSNLTDDDEAAAFSIQLIPDGADLNSATAGLQLTDIVGLDEGSTLQRSLLQVMGSPVYFYTTPVPISTAFSVPAPADAAARARVVQTVASQSPEILSGALSSFFGMPLAMVNAEDPKKTGASKAFGEKPGTPAAAAAAGKPRATQKQQQASPAPQTSSAGLAPQPHKPEPAVQEEDEDQRPRPTPTQQAQLHFKQQQRKQWQKRAPAQPLAVQYHLPAEQQLQPQPPNNRSQSTQTTVVNPLRSQSALSSVALLAPAAHAQEQQQLTPLQEQLSELFNNADRGDISSSAYDQALSCPFPPTKSNSMPDKQGRLWSINAGKECVFRPDTNITPSTPIITWTTAADCAGSPDEQNSVTDDVGRLWGWQAQSSCAFRSFTDRNSVPPNLQAKSGRTDAQAFQELMSNLSGGHVSVVWEAAAACPFAPTAVNAVPDRFGRLWSWHEGKSCAFKVSAC